MTEEFNVWADIFDEVFDNLEEDDDPFAELEYERCRESIAKISIEQPEFIQELNKRYGINDISDWLNDKTNTLKGVIDIRPLYSYHETLKAYLDGPPPPPTDEYDLAVADIKRQLAEYFKGESK